MMREILFRGKRIDNGKWVEGFYVKGNKPVIYPAGNPTISKALARELRPFHSAKSTQKIMTEIFPVDPETVGQFTGLTDKNGKKIFEGDIIKIPGDYDEFGHNAGEIYEVYFCCGCFRLKPKYSNARGYWLEDDNTVEIIGNIHDNPQFPKEDA